MWKYDMSTLERRALSITMEELPTITFAYSVDAMQLVRDEDLVIDIVNNWLQIGLYQEAGITVAYGDWLLFVINKLPLQNIKQFKGYIDAIAAAHDYYFWGSTP